MSRIRVLGRDDARQRPPMRVAEYELWNWARWCWEGPIPHPMPAGRCGSAESDALSGPPCEEVEQEPRPLPINYPAARRVQALYEALPLVHQRVIQAEYPRRGEYDGMTRQERHQRAAWALSISVERYRQVVGRFMDSVEREAT